MNSYRKKKYNIIIFMSAAYQVMQSGKSWGWQADEIGSKHSNPSERQEGLAGEVAMDVKEGREAYERNCG